MCIATNVFDKFVQSLKNDGLAQVTTEAIALAPTQQIAVYGLDPSTSDSNPVPHAACSSKFVSSEFTYSSPSSSDSLLGLVADIKDALRSLGLKSIDPKARLVSKQPIHLVLTFTNAEGPRHMLAYCESTFVVTEYTRICHVTVKYTFCIFISAIKFSLFLILSRVQYRLRNKLQYTDSLCSNPKINSKS